MNDLNNKIDDKTWWSTAGVILVEVDSMIDDTTNQMTRQIIISSIRSGYFDGVMGMLADLE